MTNARAPFNNDAQSSIGLSFIKVYNRWHKTIKEELKVLNLTHPQFIVLASLGYLSHQKEEINQVDISKQSDIDVMTVSTIIRNIEKMELITRHDSLQDTRAKSVKLTTLGTEKLAQALPIVEAVDERFFAPLASEKKQFNTLLLTLIKENTGQNIG